MTTPLRPFDAEVDAADDWAPWYVRAWRAVGRWFAHLDLR